MKRNMDGGLIFQFTPRDKCSTCSHVEVCEIVRRIQTVIADLWVTVSVEVTVCDAFEEAKRPETKEEGEKK